MNIIKVIKDEEFGLESIYIDKPKVRIGARGIIFKDNGEIVIFN